MSKLDQYFVVIMKDGEAVSAPLTDAYYDEYEAKEAAKTRHLTGRCYYGVIRVSLPYEVVE